jgi:MFS family permease
MDHSPTMTQRRAQFTRPEHEQLSPAAKRAIKGASFGLFVDYYEIYLPVIALTPAIAYFQSHAVSSSTLLTLSYVTLAVTLIGRPLGAMIFGAIADVTGRRRATLIAVGGAGACTLLVGLLPGYETIGWLSMASVILLRFVGGVFMGGEYTGANPLAMESSPKRMRGLVGGIIGMALPAGFIAISLVVMATFTLAPIAGVDSPYVQWGWRIPFFLGGLLAGAFLIYYRKVEESDIAKAVLSATTNKRSPLREVFGKQHRAKLGRIFLLMSGLWLTAQSTVTAIPGLLTKSLGYGSSAVNTGLIVVNAVILVSYLPVALLGQRFGRRKLLIAAGLWIVIVIPPAFALMVKSAQDGSSLATVLIYATVVLVLASSPWGLVSTYIIEQFATGVRASGYGVGYSLAVIIPGLYPFYMLGLGHLMPYPYTPLVLIAIGGALTTLGAYLGPDTNDIDL